MVSFLEFKSNKRFGVKSATICNALDIFLIIFIEIPPCSIKLKNKEIRKTILKFEQFVAGPLPNAYATKTNPLDCGLKHLIGKHTIGGMTPHFIRKFNRFIHQSLVKKQFGDSCQNIWLQRSTL
jgi:hypothetical protein